MTVPDSKKHYNSKDMWFHEDTKSTKFCVLLEALRENSFCLTCPNMGFKILLLQFYRYYPIFP